MDLRIAFDATSAVHQAAGIGRYTRNLLRALAERDDEARFRIYYCGPGARAGSLPELNERFSRRAIPVSDRLMNALWHRARIPLPVQVFTGPFDILHSPDFTLPPDLGKPSVLTVHDLAFLRVPECAVPSLREYLSKTVQRSARRATRIIAVSESTKRDVIELLGIPSERVVTVLEAPGIKFRAAADPTAARLQVSGMGIRVPYILSVGTLEPRKNYARLFEAYSLLRGRGLTQRLVVAGGHGWLYEPALSRLAELNLEAHVTIVKPSDEELVGLYRAADVFVYPSLYEGFGIPPLEAMASGVPVACSNSSSMPEIVGETAVLFDPTDVEAMAHAVQSILDDDDLRTQLRAAGLQRASTFTWRRAAEETMAVYREAARG